MLLILTLSGAYLDAPDSNTTIWIRGVGWGQQVGWFAKCIHIFHVPIPPICLYCHPSCHLWLPFHSNVSLIVPHNTATQDQSQTMEVAGAWTGIVAGAGAGAGATAAAGDGAGTCTAAVAGATYGEE